MNRRDFILLIAGVGGAAVLPLMPAQTAVAVSSPNLSLGWGIAQAGTDSANGWHIGQTTIYVPIVKQD